MPSRLKRDQKDTRNLHFLTWSCGDRQPFLLEPGAMEFVEATLEQVRRDYDFYITGYVLMPEHVHLLMSEPKNGTVAEAMSALKGSTSKKLICGRSRFWLPRYYDFNVFTEKKRLEKLDYIHQNPIKRGLVATAEEYRWSSCRHHMLGEFGVVEIESQWTARQRERRSGGIAGPPIAPKAAR
ncbi:MAG TPA: transposase [Acidobacteriaceae bacterium]|jgi:putative transposase